ncbi:MAG TPA: ACP S-malonyltransferase, partial [Candidatus Krumholzibacteria bacterium]|nr:ACP S-malonyltransferase [Candidatus Krumholzibacteria bacterium]
GFDLAALCFEGPMEELTETRNAQPAILLHSLAVATVIRERLGFVPDFVAGHSLGEFSAAAAVGSLGADDALRVVRRRGELMWDAGQKVPGTMAAVMGLDPAAITEVLATIEDGRVVVANLNSEKQSVISGDVAAVEAAVEPLEAAGARRVMPLSVSGAFHSPLMDVVREDFAEFLAGVRFADPGAPVVANVTARPCNSGDELRKGFVDQLVSPVRWHDSVAWMVGQGVTTFVEVGPGNVLTTLGARSFRNAEFVATSDAEGTEKVLASLRERG